MKILFVPDKLSTIFLIDFFIMDLIVIAQLITSAATLIVASILIWQMLIQKKTLDIAHKDADNDFSVQVVSERNAMRRWFTDKLDPEFEKKLKLGLDKLSDYQIQILAIYFRGMSTITTTEWRLERVNGDPEYYKFALKALFSNKSMLDYYKTHGRVFFRDGNFGKSGLGEIADSVYEELSGEKLK